MHTGFWWRNLKKVIIWKTYSIYFSINKMYFEEIAFDAVNWINLAQGRGKWRAPVNIVISLRIS
jgi:uncharacterized protein YggT (Ycf19 family)